ncbi:MAG TPA: hypothetical protein VFV33_06000, partial [Gemmatimonadaceae bacterium]|nr:hypothetical protein [Gemmatimonadaceae bacterium]
CGVVYAKARPRGVAPVAVEAPAFPTPEYVAPPPTEWHLGREESRRERIVRIFAVPVVLLLAFGITRADFGHMVARVFASMWIHELGHAVSAWLCGHFALPGPWRTMVGDERSAFTIALVLAAWILLAFEGWRRERRLWIVLAIIGMGVQLVGTFGLARSTARMLFTFGGDAGCFVLGALLMVTFYGRADGHLRKSWLRWGFLVIGAIAFMDAADTWWGALRDVDKIPFGQIEGVGLSDPVKLTETHGWSVTQMTRRYVGVSLVSLTAVAVAYVLGLFSDGSEGEDA